jgi:hypothetical protein
VVCTLRSGDLAGSAAAGTTSADSLEMGFSFPMRDTVSGFEVGGYVG